MILMSAHMKVVVHVGPAGHHNERVLAHKWVLHS